MKVLIIIVSCLCLSSCIQEKSLANFKGYFSKNVNTDLISNDWFLKDIEKDSLPGISLERAYNELINKKNLSPIVVAVIDTEVDDQHEDLLNSFWINNSEIPNNKVDDDENGYVDDYRGWNFLGNIEGQNVINTLYEYVRIVRDSLKYEKIDTSSFDYKQYSRAKKEFKVSFNKTKRLTEVGQNYIEDYRKGIDYLHNYIQDTLTKTNIAQFLVKNPNSKDSIEGALLWINQDVSYKDLINNFNGIKRRYNYHLNIEYNDRAVINDEPLNINDRKYGNAELSKNLKELYHGTAVSGVLASNRNNDKGINGFGNFIKIMPIAVSGNGDENDKDMALAIYYAIDNGAKIINISSGKYYSRNYSWVQEAIKYASSKDVLIVVGAGNDNKNLDKKNTYFFPNDIDPNSDTVISHNFIRVGASSFDNSLKWTSSNYGKTEVDLFAPGNSIRVPLPYNKYEIVAGTSFSSPLVSGVAALLRSTYPSLTAPEVKQILMDSSVKYDILVDVPTEENPKQQLPFSELSKSGGIVNAYNAMLMAKEYVRNKK